MSNKYEAVECLEAGDIGAILGLKETRTGDTPSDPNEPVTLEAMHFPQPVIGYAIEARSSKHLDVVLEKLRSDYQVEVNRGQPQIAYRESFTRTVTHRTTFKKQNRGSGNFAEIEFQLLPREDGRAGLEFIDAIRGGAIPREFIASVQKGFERAMHTGALAGYRWNP